MSSSAEHGYDFFEHSLPGDDAERVIAAQLKAGSILQAWRNRFTDGSQGGAVNKTYPSADGGSVHIASGNQSRAIITVLSDESSATYYFDAASPHIEVTDSSQAEPLPPTEAYERFSRLIFDCDRIELRGQ